MKRISLLLIAITILLCLAGCSDGNGIPEGMRILRADEELGYYMYAPEEWTVSNQGDVSMAYASRIDLSSVTYVEAEMPECTVNEYFEASKSEFPTAPTMVIDGEACDFGSAEGCAESAIKFVYDYEYSGHKFRIMQIFTKYQNRFGIFTFTSYNENINSDELTQYDYYLEKVQKIIDNFKYVEKINGSPSPAPEYDSDGYTLVSNPKVSGFSLYLPEGYTVNNSSGMVSASLSDGSTITLSKATHTGTGITDYLRTRRESMQLIVSDFSDVKISISTEVDPESAVYENWQFDVMPTTNPSLSFGNLRSEKVIAYEYEYTYNGERYHVYQLMGVDTFNGYVFTYTAKNENYSLHIDEIIEISKRIVF